MYKVKIWNKVYFDEENQKVENASAQQINVALIYIGVLCEYY